MLDIHYQEGLAPDERLQKAIARGVYLAEQQGSDIKGLSFYVRKPSKILPMGAGAGPIEGERNIGLAVDASNPNYDVVSQLMVHEINHLKRERYSPIKTLEEVLVSEGLAQMAEEVAGFELLDVSFFQSSSDRAKIIKTMMSDFGCAVFGEEKERDYDSYFGVDGVVPDYAGYALGYEMVKLYMQEQGVDLSVATQTPAREIVSYWENSLQAT